MFDDVRVEHQVRYLGLLENVRVRRAGFCYRQRYDKFLLRYKMLSEYTWPNFRGGSDKEGVRVLMNEKKFSNDVKYGHTKIFIRSPQTLFGLEKMRNDMIPHIVIFLQRQVRGWLARQLYKKMKAAAVLMRWYRRKKLSGYVEELADTFRNAKQMRDYGKSLTWPTPPLAGRYAEEQLKLLFNKWRAQMILRKYPRSEWPRLRLQIIAAEALRNRRRFWGQDRKWLGNYLSNTHENSNYNSYNASINNMKNTEAFRVVAFSSFVKKFNHNNKSADRAIIVTDTGIYKLDSAKNKFKDMKRSVTYKEVGENWNILLFIFIFFFSLHSQKLFIFILSFWQLTGVSVSPGRDQLVVFHSTNNNDLVVSLTGESQPLKEDRIGEIVAHVCKMYRE